MPNLNIFDKIGVIFSSLFSSPTSIIVSILCIFVVTTLIIMYKFNYKHTKKAFVVTYMFGLFLLLTKASTQVFTMLDGSVDIIFKNLYFPRLDVVLFVTILSNIILFATLFSSKIQKKYKILNISFSVLTTLISFILISQIVTNNINNFSDILVYNNHNLLALAETVMGLFVLHIIVLSFIKTVDVVSFKIDEKDLLVMPEASNVKAVILDSQKKALKQDALSLGKEIKEAIKNNQTKDLKEDAVEMLFETKPSIKESIIQEINNLEKKENIEILNI